jgi:hypothetical protein
VLYGFLGFVLRFGTIIPDLFEALEDSASGALAVIVSILTGVVEIFYAGEAGLETLTVYGYLLLVSAGFALVWRLISWFRSLVAMRG